jgi:plastocyanin
MLRRVLALSVLVSAAAVFVPSTSLAGGCHAGRATQGRSNGNVLVHVAKCGFQPTILYVEPGSEVTWVNDDPMPHTVTGTGLSLNGDKQMFAGDKTRPFRFDDAGVYPYYCILHPGMVGAVVVGDVSAAKADARTIPAQPVAVTNTNVDEQPPATGSDGGSSVPYALAFLAIVAAALGALTLVRRREHGPLPPEESTAARS